MSEELEAFIGLSGLGAAFAGWVWWVSENSPLLREVLGHVSPSVWLMSIGLVAVCAALANNRGEKRRKGA